MVDTADLKSAACLSRHAGSSPAARTIYVFNFVETIALCKGDAERHAKTFTASQRPELQASMLLEAQPGEDVRW